MDDETRLALQKMNEAIESLIDAVNLLNRNDQALLEGINQVASDAGVVAQLKTQRVSH